jgi:putative molybdopterin biosynthesis protein
VALQYRGLPPGEPAQSGAQLGNDLFDLLHAVRERGSIAAAAQATGCSYRHAWGALKAWEQSLGAAVLVWTQGQKARLTPFGDRLLWAERQARTRLQPHIEALRSALGRVVNEARESKRTLLTVCASHDLALPLLQDCAGAAGLDVDIRFAGSVDSLRALNAGQCLVAGFHVALPEGGSPRFKRALKPLLEPGLHKLIGCSRRQQGLMLRAEHAAHVRTLADAVRLQLRFVNRQPGAGTRLLLDQLLSQQQVDPLSLPGYLSHVEPTHVAVAGAVASGAADTGLGLEAAAREFGLHFVPLVEEEYFLVCLVHHLDHPAVAALRVLLAGPAWAETLRRRPGYRGALAPGAVLAMTTVLPWWHFRDRRRPPMPRPRPSRAQTAALETPASHPDPRITP